MENKIKRGYTSNFLLALLSIFALISVFWLFAQYVSNTSIRYAVFSVLTVAGIALQVYIYKKGGFIPKNGKRTVHSKIIFWSAMAAFAVLIAFIIAVYFMIYRQP